MKCESLFSGKNKKNINLSSAELAWRVVMYRPTDTVKKHFFFGGGEGNLRLDIALQMIHIKMSSLIFIEKSQECCLQLLDWLFKELTLMLSMLGKNFRFHLIYCFLIFLQKQG